MTLQITALHSLQMTLEHGVYLNYGVEDAQDDLAEIRRFGELTLSEPFAGARPAE